MVEDLLDRLLSSDDFAEEINSVLVSFDREDEHTTYNTVDEFLYEVCGATEQGRHFNLWKHQRATQCSRKITAVDKRFRAD